MNEWMNEQTHKWTNKQTNKWINEWMNEWIVEHKEEEFRCEGWMTDEQISCGRLREEWIRLREMMTN